MIKDAEPTPELPPEARLTMEAYKLHKTLALDSQRRVAQRVGHAVEVANYLILEDTKVELALKSIGCDEVAFRSIEKDKFDGGLSDLTDSPKHTRAPEAIVITMALYSDGERMELEGDTPNSLSSHILVLAPEMPPTVVHAAQTEDLDPDAWEKTHKHILSTEDCQLLLDKLPSIQVDIDQEAGWAGEDS